MKIQYCSDLHLEFPENMEYLKTHPLQPKGDVLLLAGDIVPFTVMHKYADFFSYISDNFKTTYWVPGNHEYYYYDAAEKCGILNEKIKSNIFLVNNTSVIHDNVKFIFTTLWSKISLANRWEIESRVSDFHVIKFKGSRFSALQFNQFYEESLAFLKQELNAEKTNNTIVVSHHVPTFLNYPEKYKGDLLNEAFTVELFDLIEKSKIDYWIFGHHHVNINAFTIGSVTLLTNQLGYIRNNENAGFDNNKHFETFNDDIQYNKAIFAQ